MQQPAEFMIYHERIKIKLTNLTSFEMKSTVMNEYKLNMFDSSTSKISPKKNYTFTTYSLTSGLCTPDGQRGLNAAP